jgi:hypothetical protein
MQHGDAKTRLPNTRSTQCGHDTLQYSSTERDSLRHQVGSDAAIVVTRFAIVPSHMLGTVRVWSTGPSCRAVCTDAWLLDSGSSHHMSSGGVAASQ